jgi:hypothetical protein
MLSHPFSKFSDSLYPVIALNLDTLTSQLLTVRIVLDHSLDYLCVVQIKHLGNSKHDAPCKPFDQNRTTEKWVA